MNDWADYVAENPWRLLWLVPAACVFIAALVGMVRALLAKNVEYDD